MTLLLSAATSFNGYDKSPVRDGRDAAAAASAPLRGALGKRWDDLRREHVANHRALFDRLAFSLGPAASRTTAPAGGPAPLPTDQRIIKLGATNPLLVELLFQYGRYLLIAGSRPGTQPANLQGIWNDHCGRRGARTTRSTSTRR